MKCDTHGALIRLLLARGGPGCRLVASRERPWASITFEGARHVVELAMPTDATAALLEGIEEAEFDLREHIVADLAVTGHHTAADDLASVRIEALTLLVR